MVATYNFGSVYLSIYLSFFLSFFLSILVRSHITPGNANFEILMK